MEHLLAAKKNCPECGSEDYQFRSRKSITAKEHEQEVVETKYRCKSCGHEWKVKTSARKV
jgi:transposase-like protein